VFANHVKGLMPGCYLYDTAAHRLETATPGVPDGLLSQFLYISYFTRLNYNLEQVAAVIAISGRLNAMVSTYGARGYAFSTRRPVASRRPSISPPPPWVSGAGPHWVLIMWRCPPRSDSTVRTSGPCCSCSSDGNGQGAPTSTIN
jgi:hypothetical protein